MPLDNRNKRPATVRAYVAGMGIVSALGIGWAQTREALADNRTGVRPLTLFPTVSGKPLPVGEIPWCGELGDPPRTHQLARLAGDQAMAAGQKPPDAVVMGVTTGGLLRTEHLLANEERDPRRYRWHAVGSVAEDLAERYGCKGPALTVSTACSSGTAALKIALNMLRSGMAKRVLAGGADSLCRLTYHGFHALQLIDPEGARPLDEDRRGMSVGEGAGMLLLTADEPKPVIAELLGGGLSCDAYHPAAPEPQGTGALKAMREALSDAGLHPHEIDYINLHGTGTRDNDVAEARAVQALFGVKTPSCSSVKGATGHSLAAAGAIEAVIAARCISDGMVPANAGCMRPDPALMLTPLLRPAGQRVGAVLSNSFGFGGGNAAIVMGAPGKGKGRNHCMDTVPMTVLGHSCITGAGKTRETMIALEQGRACGGVLNSGEIAAGLASGQVRRLKRFPRLALSLAADACPNPSKKRPPTAVFMGTGWGALSETNDFLRRLFETGEKFPSPTDFVGSVHNAAAGQVAMHFKATGANLTMTGGDYSFEQALTVAAVMPGSGQDDFLVMGADENHPTLSQRLDPSVAMADDPADGGGALYLTRGKLSSGPSVQPLFFETGRNNPDILSRLLASLEKHRPLDRRYGVILAGLPAAVRSEAVEQLAALIEMTGYRGTIIDYRKHTGEFATASAVAVVMALHMLQKGNIPSVLANGRDTDLADKGALVLGLGKCVTAIEVMNA
ncbi:MAG: beta-ketoacyl synthase chain length factor [Deltaproteobacteria bacterium]|nr:beta-ketoacyl synthase chain length factor [Deltaproteobacteria bacterium]